MWVMHDNSAHERQKWCGHDKCWVLKCLQGRKGWADERGMFIIMIISHMDRSRGLLEMVYGLRNGYDMAVGVKTQKMISCPSTTHAIFTTSPGRSGASALSGSLCAGWGRFRGIPLPGLSATHTHSTVRRWSSCLLRSTSVRVVFRLHLHRLSHQARASSGVSWQSCWSSIAAPSQSSCRSSPYANYPNVSGKAVPLWVVQQRCSR